MEIFELDDEEKTVAPKQVEQFTVVDFEKVDDDKQALFILTLALAHDIALRFRENMSAKALWKSLVYVYEGNEDI